VVYVYMEKLAGVFGKKKAEVAGGTVPMPPPLPTNFPIA
jgi:hypothetical protein